MSVVVSDTSPIHYLILCEAIELLPRLFNQVLVPPAVYAELLHEHAPTGVRSWAQKLPSWAAVQKPTSLDLTLNVDRGELEAICLAREIKASTLLMDDLKGRMAAQRCGLLVTGTLGILEAASARGFLDLAPTLERLKQTNARLDPSIITAALERDRARRRG